MKWLKQFPRNRNFAALSLVGLTTSLWVSLHPPIAVAMPAPVSEGYTLLNRGWVNDAIAQFQQALKRYPNSLDARLGLAIAYQRAGRDGDAWTAYRRVLMQDPNNRTALAAVGVLGGYRTEWQAAGITALTRLLQQTPNDTAARTQRALLLGYQGRYAESFADYRTLLQAPKPEALLGAAQIYSYSGSYAQSRSLFNRYRATGKALPDGSLTAYARTLAETGDRGQAIQLLEAKLRQPNLPDWLAPDLRGTLAIVYQMNQQPEQALQVLQPLRNQPRATVVLARALSVLGRRSGNPQLFQESVALYRQALQQTANPSYGLVLEAADVLSETAVGQMEALQLYRQLQGQQPTDRSLLVRRLVVERQLGQISGSEAQQQLLAALQPLPELEGDRQAVALALSRLDAPEPELLPLYRELVQSGVDVPFLNLRIAQIQMQQGDLNGAKQAIAAYQQTELGKQDLGTELLLAEIERRESRLDASASRYEAVIAKNPGDPVLQNALLGLATVRREQGRLQEVLRVYDALLAKEPGNARAQMGQLNLKYQLKTISAAEAEAGLEQWLRAQPQLIPYPELRSLVGALPPDPRRESLYLALLAADPDDIALERRLIQVIATRDPEAARSRLQQRLARDRGSISGYFLQGELAQTFGDFDVASQAYQAILQQQPDNADALSALAGVRFQQQRYEEAAALYQRVIALKPGDLETQRILADLYLAQDLPGKGFRQLQRVQQQQAAQGIANSTVTDRLQETQLNFLRRRGLQPSWERY